MGLFRFMLAAIVVLYHFGGLPWLSGRLAVFGFYVISGFLIFQVLDRVYLDERRGVSRFFANRLVRLGPLYITYVALTAAFVSIAGIDAIVNGDGRPALRGDAVSEMAIDSLTFGTTVARDGNVPVVAFDAPLIPQGWSIGVEASFYLMAPLVVAATRRSPWRMAVWIGAGLAILVAALDGAGVDFDRFQTLVYKNAAASWVVFFAGGALYYARRRWGQPVPFVCAAALVVLWPAITLIPLPALESMTPPSSQAFAQYLWITFVATAVVVLTKPWRFRAIDQTAGNLSYGIYLNHFLVAAPLAHPWLRPFVAEPGTLTFGALVVILSAAAAWVTYALVERPFDTLRAHVRGQSVAPQPAERLRIPAPAVLAAALCLMLVGRPVAEAVEEINEADETVPAVSAPFHVRWAPGIDDEARARLESELDLAEGEQMAHDPRRRTWRYRMSRPTESRVRRLVEHPAVEDTAAIDRERFVIEQ